MGDFYGTEIEIWAGFGPVGITEKKHGPIADARLAENCLRIECRLADN